MVFLSDHWNSIFIDKVHYKHKDWQFHGIFIIRFHMSVLSPHMEKVGFSA